MGIAVLDRFNRTDSATTIGTAESGQAWSGITGTWGISSGKAYNTSATASGVVTMPTSVSDCDIYADITYAGDDGIAFRQAGVSSYFMCRFAGSTLDLYRNSGGFSLLGQASTTNTVGVAQNLRVSLSGSTIKAYINGALAITATDTNYTTVTSHGFYCSNSTARFDNFTILAPGYDYGTVLGGGYG